MCKLPPLNLLGPVVPENLVTIVFFGIVTGSDHDSATGSLLDHSERNPGSGCDGTKKVDLEAEAGKDACGETGPASRIVAGIVSNHNPFGFSLEHKGKSW